MGNYFEAGVGKTEPEARADFYRKVAQRHQIGEAGVTIVSEKYMPKPSDGTVLYRGAYTLTSSAGNGVHESSEVSGLEVRAAGAKKKQRTMPVVESAAGTGPSLVSRVRTLSNPFE